MGFFDSLFKGITNKTDILSNAFDQTVSKVSNSKEEFASELSVNKDDNSYSTNGVHLKSTSNMLNVVYDGILAKNGAKEIYAIVGYGDNEKWEDIKSYSMNTSGDNTFKLLFPVDKSAKINIVFKDNADHWDNNSGTNYSFNNHIQQEGS